MKGAIAITLCLSLVCISCVRVSESTEPFKLELILRNMPVNSDLRCTGITLVAEALFEGELVSGDECDRPDELAKMIFASAGSGASVRYHSRLCLEAGAEAIQSRESLDRLSIEVANL